MPALKVYPTIHSWIVTSHVSIGNLPKQIHLFTYQRNIISNIIKCLEEDPHMSITMTCPLKIERGNLENLYTAYLPAKDSVLRILNA